MTQTTKLPTDQRALVRDPDLAAAIEAVLEPYTGKQLERAQQAVRRVRASGIQAPFSDVLNHYKAAIEDAVTAKS